MRPTAIIGMACKLPGSANTPEQFWVNLMAGKDCISMVPSDRFAIEKFFDPEQGKPGRINSRVGGFVDDVKAFDSLFVGIAPREAVSMDPQQRLVLETSCLERIRDQSRRTQQRFDRLKPTPSWMYFRKVVHAGKGLC